MPLHVGKRRMVGNALQRERIHQTLEQGRCVVICDGALEPSDFRDRLVADQMFITSEAADRFDQHHSVIERGAKL
jgi:starvation-inducible outer membrane lipoprotein